MNSVDVKWPVESTHPFFCMGNWLWKGLFLSERLEKGSVGPLAPCPGKAGELHGSIGGYLGTFALIDSLHFIFH